ncbi:hypothetical protein CPC197_0791B, partial [Chlamydia psittaci C1/97]
ILKAIECFH